MENSKEKTLDFLEKNHHVKTSQIKEFLGVSRQRAHAILKELVMDGRLVKIGTTIDASYADPKYAASHIEIFPKSIHRHFKNGSLEEHIMLDEIENHFPLLLKLEENVRDIFTYAFSEMLNNAIEHSGSESIDVQVSIEDENLIFSVNDSGVGVFRNIMEKKSLGSELEAVQDLLKGKTTTMPKSHSGEGIFFTSKIADAFTLESFGLELIVDNKIEDIFLNEPVKKRTGTRVFWSIGIKTKKHLNDVFKRFSDIDEASGLPSFDRTEVKIRLYVMSGVHFSRSQARRVLHGLDKFKKIIFDFDQVPMVGQAFADEVFRVFQNRHPDISLEAIGMSDAVKFMVDRAKWTNPRTPDLFQ